MLRRIRYAFIALALSVQVANALVMTVTKADPLTDKVAAITSIDGEPVDQTNFPSRIRFYETAMVYPRTCYSSATGRDWFALGGDLDLSILGPVPAFHCGPIDRTSALVASALARAKYIVPTPNGGLLITDGTDIIMTLQILTN